VSRTGIKGIQDNLRLHDGHTVLQDESNCLTAPQQMPHGSAFCGKRSVLQTDALRKPGCRSAGFGAGNGCLGPRINMPETWPDLAPTSRRGESSWEAKSDAWWGSLRLP
jgi:hypothetical protein